MPFIKGILLGFGLVMPLGPLNLYIFNNSSMQKRVWGILPVILVAGLCDLSLILFAVLGVDVISQVSWFVPIMMVIGSAFLFYMGVKMWTSTTSEPPQAAIVVQTIPSQMAYSAMLSLLNPHAILDTFVVIGAVSATYLGSDKHTFTAGCMASDLLWFIFLGVSGFFLRRLRYGQKIFYCINKISSIIMIGLAVQLTITLLRDTF